MKGISRIDTRGAGWFVRLYRKDKVISRFFSDGKYGGKEKALRVAQVYYRQATQEYPAEPKKPFRETLLRNNRSGYNGICETFTRSRKGTKIPCWSVSWNYPPNKGHTKSFYFHDEQERKQALREARRFRKEREAELLKKQNRRNRMRAE
jgi:hypothetical protein